MGYDFGLKLISAVEGAFTLEKGKPKNGERQIVYEKWFQKTLLENYVLNLGHCDTNTFEEKV